MPSPTLSRRFGLAGSAPLTLVALAGLALTACGSDSGSGSSTKVDVTAGDDSCDVASTELAAGSTTFAVTNEGSKVTELYVYGEADGAFTKVVSEVENIGPGTSRDLTVDLAAGTYELACKPGQKGDGIRSTVTVTGSGGGTSSSSDEGYDAEIELTVDDAGLRGLDDQTATTGERIEFKLDNETDGTRTLEVLDPAGTVAAEFDVPAGKNGEAIVQLADPGDWTVKVEGGPSDLESTLTVRDPSP